MTKLLYYTKCQSQKREKSQPNIYRILPKVNQVIYTIGTVCIPNIMILTQAVIQIFCWQSSIGLQCIKRKREIIQPNIHRILPKVNQVIYTMATVYIPNIMILTQAVLQIFCWQSSIGLQCIKRKREIIQPNIYRILPKVNQVIYTMATVYIPNIMILTQAVLQIFCWQSSIGLQCIKRKREIIQPNIHRISWKINQVIYTLDTILVSNIMILAQAVLLIFCWQGPSWVKCASEKGNNSLKYSQNLMKT